MKAPRDRGLRPGIRRLLRLATGRRASVHEEVDEEIRNHIELQTRLLTDRGMPLDQARRQAEQQFGLLDRARPELHRLARRRSRALHVRHWWQDLGQDLRLALRNVRRNAAFSITATVILGLGIGMNAAVFSVFDSVLLRPLPYRDPQQLVVVWRTERAQHNLSAAVFDTHRNAADWRARSHSFAGLAEASWAQGSLVYRGAGAPPREVLAIPVSSNFFDVLGVRPTIGRSFTNADAEGGCSVVLSHRFWLEMLHGDQAVVGRSISVGDAPCTVAGVMPATFEFYPRHADLWTLMTPASDSLLRLHPDHYLVGVFGRLRSGVTAAAAERELVSLDQQSASSPTERALQPAVFDLQSSFTWLAGRNLRTTLLLALGAVGLVLLLVCVNIANLSLSRAMTRQRELAVRMALGSGRGRLVRQLLTESALLTVLGTAAGLALAVSCTRFVNTGQLIELPPGGSAQLDLPVTAAIVAMMVVVMLLVGTLPAWRATRVNTVDSLKSGGRGATWAARAGRLSGALVTTQVALSVTLLVGAGLMSESLQRLAGAPLGYSPNHVLTVRVDLATRDSTAARRFFNGIADRIAAERGGLAIALTSRVPIEGTGYRYPVEVQGAQRAATDSIADVGQQTISPSYFQLMRVPLLAGRTFSRADDARAGAVAIVNRAFVERYLPHASAAGQRIRVQAPNETWLTIVGVAGDEQRTTVAHEMGWSTPAMIYRPVAQVRAPASLIVLIRSADQPAVVGQAARRAILAASPDAIVTEITPMPELVGRFLASPRARAELLGALAVLAVTLAVVGLYGLLSQLVTQRTQEIGIRLALGAQRGQVVGLIVARGVKLAAVGAVAGALLSLPCARLMRALLYGVSPFDVVTLIAATGALIVTAVAASWIPARRAAALDPTTSLRAE